MKRASMYARRLHVTCLWFLLGSACTGAIDGGPVGASGDSDQNTGTGQGDDSGRTPEEGGYDPETEGGLADLPSSETRFARLTHAQWQNTVRDLFGLPAEDVASFAEALRADAAQSGFLFDNLGEGLSVDEALWTGYRKAASDVAARVTSDGALLGRFDTQSATAFVNQLGLRAYRRPLSSDEVSEHVALFEAAKDLYADLPAQTAGARLVIEAMLQSPLFVYRVEQSERVQGAVIPLDSYEVASRLSYFLWNTVPDDALFEAASTDQLTKATRVKAEVERMLDDPRALSVLTRFHETLFETSKLAGISPSPAFYPDAPATLAASARKEQAMFLQNVLFDGERGVRELLTSRETFVNKDLAQVYGLAGEFGDEFVAVNLADDQRSGMLTQVGFLASHATSVESDPIHRGVFVARRIACLNLPAPPANIPPLPAIEGATTRERVVAHTEAPGSNCAGCHATVINPLGFPFEHYDALGAFRTEDSGKPVNSASSPPIDGKATPVADALALSELLADSQSVHACYLKHWLEFAHGRPERENDEAQIGRLSAASLDGALSIRRMLVALTASEAFLTRSTQELP